MAIPRSGFLAGGGGKGDVSGPSSSTDDALARFDGGTGKTLQDSTAILSDDGVLSGITLLSPLLVEANTADSGAPNVLTAAESGTVFTNEGTTAQNYHTLPSAVAGYQFEFIVQDSDGIRIVAASGDTIRLGTAVSGVAGYTESTTIGDYTRLIAINTTEWIAAPYQGTWTTV